MRSTWNWQLKMARYVRRSKTSQASAFAEYFCVGGGPSCGVLRAASAPNPSVHAEMHSPRMTNTEIDTIADDLLDGAAAIGEFLGWTPRRVYHIHRSGKWPIFNDGSGMLFARKSSLRAFIAECERAAMDRNKR
jgi:hypothetical protein